MRSIFVSIFFISMSAMANVERFAAVLTASEVQDALKEVAARRVQIEFISMAKCIPGIYRYEIVIETYDSKTCSVDVQTGSCGKDEPKTTVGKLECK